MAILSASTAFELAMRSERDWDEISGSVFGVDEREIYAWHRHSCFCNVSRRNRSYIPEFAHGDIRYDFLG